MRKITVGDQVFIQPSRVWDWFNPRNIVSANDTTFTTVDGDNIENLVKVCACGCDEPFEKVYARVSRRPNPDQARAQLKSKMIPANEVNYGY